MPYDALIDLLVFRLSWRPANIRYEIDNTLIDSKEIINLNKAVVPKDIGRKTSSKEYNIRTELDPVSILSKAQFTNKNDITIPSRTLNPLEEHSTDTLDRLDQDLQVGRGHLIDETGKQVPIYPASSARTISLIK